jgi:NADH-quinone oxidoreductase subunit J
MLFQDTVFWILAVIAIGGALGVVLVKDLFRAALLLVVVFMAVAGFFVLMSAEFLAVVQVLIYVGAISILIIFAVMLTRDVQQGNLPNQLQIPAVLFAAVLLAVLVVVATDTNWDLTADALAERAQTLSGQARLEEGAGRDLISETAQAAIDGGELDQAEVAGLLATELQDRVDLVQTHSGSIVTDEALGRSGFDTPESKTSAREAGVDQASLADLLIGDFVLPFEAVSLLLLAALIGSLVLVRPR